MQEEFLKKLRTQTLDVLIKRERLRSPLMHEKLRHFGPSVSVLLVCLAAMQCLAQDKASRVQEAIQQLKSDNPAISSKAAWSLGRDDLLDDTAVPALIDALKVLHLGPAATTALINIGKRSKNVTPQLINALKSPDEKVREYSIKAITGIGENAKEAVPYLITALNDNSAFVPQEAAKALGVIGKNNKQAIDQLIKAINHRSFSVQTEAINALGNMGAEAEAALPELTSCFYIEIGAGRKPGEAADTVVQIAKALQDAKSIKSLHQLKLTYTAMKTYGDRSREKERGYIDDDINKKAAEVKRAIDYLEALEQGQWLSHIGRFLGEHYIVFGFVAFYILLQIFWALCLWQWPLLLLRVNVALDKLGSFKFYKVETPLSVSLLLIAWFFRYRPRLLNHWVNQYIDLARKSFVSKLTEITKG